MRMKGLAMKTKRRWLLALAAGGLLLIAAGAAAFYVKARRPVTTSSKAAYEAYEEAVANEERFYFKEARLGFARAVELDPTFAMAMLGLARQSPDQEQRKTLVRRAAKERAHLTERERYHVEIQLAGVENRTADVLRLAHEAHAKFPEDVRTAEIIAMEQMGKGNPDEAMRVFQEVLSVDPNNAQAYNQIGYRFGYQGDYQKALDNLEKYRFIAPDTANPFDSLGEVQAYSGHYPEAIENLNHALAIKPDFVPSQKNLGVVYEGMGDYRKAIEAYERAAQLTDKPDERRGLLTLALRAAINDGDAALIREKLARIAALPANPKDDFAEERRTTLRLVELDLEGKQAEVQRELVGMLPGLQRKWEKAKKQGEYLPNMKPHFREWNWLMARSLEKQGRADEAMKYCALNANPPNPFFDFESRRWIMEARAKLAELVARKGDLDRAEKLLAENRKWNPSWAPCRPSEVIVAQLRHDRVLAAAK